MESIKNNLPIISVALLILGTINLLVYYNHFNVDILSYLDFTEVLQIQFRLFAISVAALAGQILYAVVSTHIISQITPFKDETSKAKKWANDFDKKMTKKLAKLSTTKVATIATIFMICLAVGLSINDPKSFYGFLWILSIAAFATVVAYAYTIFKKDILAPNNETDIESIKKDKLNAQSKLKLIRAMMSFVVIAYASGIAAKLAATFVSLYSAPREATVTMENKTFSTNKNYRFIGRTKSYIFFYDIPKKQADVFSNSDVKSIQLREGMLYEHKEDSLYKFKFTREGFREWINKANRGLN